MPEEPPPPPPLGQEPERKPWISTTEDIADKVGFVPNIRKSDNVLQAKIIGVVVLLCTITFLIIHPFGAYAPLFADIGGGVIAGLILGLLVSGTILAVIGLKR